MTLSVQSSFPKSLNYLEIFRRTLREQVTQPPNITELRPAQTVHHDTKGELGSVCRGSPADSLYWQIPAVASDDSTELATSETEDAIPTQMHKQLAIVSPTPASRLFQHQLPIEEVNPSAAFANRSKHPGRRCESGFTLSRQFQRPVINEVQVSIDQLPILPTNLSESRAPPQITSDRRDYCLQADLPPLDLPDIECAASVGPNAEPNTRMSQHVKG